MKQSTKNMLAAIVLGVSIPVVVFAGGLAVIFGISVALETFGWVVVALAATWAVLWVCGVVWAFKQARKPGF